MSATVQDCAQGEVNLRFAASILDYFADRAALFVLSPGARCAPLAVLLNERLLPTVVHFDERGSAFFALGAAKAFEKPVVLICTSGTALANYLPAICEAYHSRVPLVVLSADRPEELHNCGANQTMEQGRVLEGFVATQRTIEAPFEGDSPELLFPVLEEVFREVLYESRPVHLNCRFREPLVPGPDNCSIPPVVEFDVTERSFSASPKEVREVEELVRAFDSADKPLILAGAIRKESEASALLQLATDFQIPVLADLGSNIRHGGDSAGSPVILNSDVFLGQKNVLQRLSPDFVLHFGGLPISKRIWEFLESSSARCAQVQEYGDEIDPLHVMQIRCTETITALLKQIGKQCSPKDSFAAFLREWKGVEGETQKVLEGYFKGGDSRRAELERVWECCHALPEGQDFYFSNSLLIREFDLFFPGTNTGSVHYNRGLSGIDGLIASAAGWCFAKKRPCTLFIGDQAFLHDLNSVALVARLGIPLKIFLMNNGGGQIFSQLPFWRDTESFETLFAARHESTFQGVCENFGLEYLCLDESSPEISSKILEAKCPSCVECRVASRSARDSLQELRLLLSSVLQ